MKPRAPSALAKLLSNKYRSSSGVQVKLLEPATIMFNEISCHPGLTGIQDECGIEKRKRYAKEHPKENVAIIPRKYLSEHILKLKFADFSEKNSWISFKLVRMNKQEFPHLNKC